MKNRFKNYSYVLITPARNEEAYIEKTIQSVVSQSVLPEKWVIVSDGSIDRTDEIVNSYLNEFDWIDFIRMQEHEGRHFASKVFSFNEGYKRVKSLEYNVIANLDADISFGEDYFTFLLNKFSEIPNLGVAGTPFIEEGLQGYNYNFTNIEHVSGACQLFRRECFDEIGGYTPIKGGGIDWLAVTTARMKGWKTRTFTDRTCFHHRKIGTGNSSILKARFNLGKEDYYLGSHPLWEIFRAFYQLKSKPFLLSGLSLYFGYNWAFITRVQRPLSEEIINFHRKEQLLRLKEIFKKAVKM